MVFRRAQFKLVGDFSKDEVFNIPDLVRFNSKHNANHTFCFQEKSKNGALATITFAELDNAVNNCIQDLRQSLPGIDFARVEDEHLAKSSAVAIFLESGVGLFVHLVALLSMQVPVVLLSARLSITSVEHLLRETHADTIITSKRLQSNVLGDVVDSSKIHLATDYDLSNNNVDRSSEPTVPNFDEDDDKALILHSSGTTGLPKPIYHGQRYLLGYAACHEFSPDEDVSSTNVSTLPLFHGFGMLAPTLSLAIGKPCCFPYPTTVAAADSTLALLRKSSARSLMTVPSIVEDIYNTVEKKDRQILKGLDFIAVGGGALKPAIADALIDEGIKLLNHFGATELGALAPIFIPGEDYDGHYLRIRQDMGLRLIPKNDAESDEELYQLVGRAPGAHADFTLADRIRLREGTTRDVRLLGRADDTIVLANGEKVAPQLLEEELSQLPQVKTALAFGSGQFELGVIIEPEPKHSTVSENLQSYVDHIWESIQDINPKMDAHARIQYPEMVRVLSEGKTIPRSDKGSVMRMEANRMFEPEITEAYSKLEEAQTSQVNGTYRALQVDNLQECLREYVTEVFNIKAPISDSDDLFELGFDSLKAVRLQRVVSAQLRRLINADPKIDGFVYRFPTINAMKEQIEAIIEGRGEEGFESYETLHEYVDEYSAKLSIRGEVVLLTGGTGSIGSNLLAYLTSLPQVKEIICLDRRPPKPSSDTVEIKGDLSRYQKAFEKNGLNFTDDMLAKITPIPTDTSGPLAGLEETAYDDICNRVTDVIHNAWPMDFKRPVSAFNKQFKSLENLLRLAINASNVSPQQVRFAFISSIAVVANYCPMNEDSVEVPENLIHDEQIPSELGYAQAKWVCEMVVNRVARMNPSSLSATVLRVGQVSGSTTHGKWTEKEHVPALLKTSQSLKQFPYLPGTVSWLPVDIAAQTIGDIVLHNGPIDLIHHVENPNRRLWDDVIKTLQTAANLKESEFTTVPLDDWLASLRKIEQTTSQEDVSETYPALPLLDFLSGDFKKLGMGKTVLSTVNAQDKAPVLASYGPIQDETLKQYVDYWRSIGFLS